MTEQQIDILDQLMVKGYVQKTIGLLDNNIFVTLRTLPTEQQLAVEASMKTVEGTQLYALHTYFVRLLARGLVDITYKGTKTTFATPEEAEVFIQSKPALLIGALITEQGKLEKEVSVLISGPEVVENFPKTPSVDLEQK